MEFVESAVHIVTLWLISLAYCITHRYNIGVLGDVIHIKKHVYVDMRIYVTWEGGRVTTLQIFINMSCINEVQTYRHVLNDASATNLHLDEVNMET